jgi:transposase
MNVTTIGLDLAKSVFQVHGIGSHGKPLITKQLRRGKVLEFFANLPACLVGIEAFPARTIGRARSAGSVMRCISCRPAM